MAVAACSRPVRRNKLGLIDNLAALCAGCPSAIAGTVNAIDCDQYRGWREFAGSGANSNVISNGSNERQPGPPVVQDCRLHGPLAARRLDLRHRGLTRCDARHGAESGSKAIERCPPDHRQAAGMARDRLSRPVHLQVGPFVS